MIPVDCKIHEETNLDPYNITVSRSFVTQSNPCWGCRVEMLLGWKRSSVGKASDQHATVAVLIPRGSEGFFVKSQHLAQTLLHVSIHPQVQSHAFTSVRMSKILQSMSEFGGLWKH